MLWYSNSCRAYRLCWVSGSGVQGSHFQNSTTWQPPNLGDLGDLRSKPRYFQGPQTGLGVLEAALARAEDGGASEAANACSQNKWEGLKSKGFPVWGLRPFWGLRGEVEDCRSEASESPASSREQHHTKYEIYPSSSLSCFESPCKQKTNSL